MKLPCICMFEPRGNNGLEGFALNQKYFFEFLPKDKNGKPYYRVYPDANSNYYETCGVKVFNRYFKKINF